jgi:phosphate uptake regulator
MRHGPSSLVVSLPSSWAAKYKITKGNELDIVEDGPRLVIAKESRDAPSETTINITGLDRTSIMYVIRSLYRLGYDVINVTFEDPVTIYQRTGKEMGVMSVIHTEVNRLVGYEIIQEREKSCVIKDLQDSSQRDLDQVIRRIFLLLVDASKDFYDGAKQNNKALLETMEDRHDTITKFISYCLRNLNKRGFEDPKKTAYYYHILAYLDRVTDIIKYAARDLITFNKKLSPKAVDILGIVTQDIEAYYHLFYKYENSKVVKINDTRYEAEKMIHDMMQTSKAWELYVSSNMFHILEILLDLVEARTALEH